MWALEDNTTVTLMPTCASHALLRPVVVDSRLLSSAAGGDVVDVLDLIASKLNELDRGKLAGLDEKGSMRGRMMMQEGLSGEDSGLDIREVMIESEDRKQSEMGATGQHEGQPGGGGGDEGADFEGVEAGWMLLRELDFMGGKDLDENEVEESEVVLEILGEEGVEVVEAALRDLVSLAAGGVDDKDDTEDAIERERDGDMAFLAGRKQVARKLELKYEM